MVLPLVLAERVDDFEVFCQAPLRCLKSVAILGRQCLTVKHMLPEERPVLLPQKQPWRFGLARQDIAGQDSLSKLGLGGIVCDAIPKTRKDEV